LISKTINMEKAFAKVEELADNIKEYVNTRIDAVKLNAAEKSSAVIANVVAGLIVVAVFMLFFLFCSIALAFGLGEWIGKTWAGFLMVAGLYMLIGIIVWTARVKIIQLPVMNALIKKLFREDDEED
jgi:Putative Actinobacterial Holin-X, holin superfamily III